MKKRVTAVFSLILILFFTLTMFPSLEVEAASASASLSVSSGTVAVGETFTLTVSVTASGLNDNTNYADVLVTYDTSLVSIDGYNGTIQPDFFTDETNHSQSYTCTAKATGTASFSLSGQVALLYGDNTEYPVTASSSVSIVTPTTRALSSAANLTSLDTSLGAIDVSSGTSWRLNAGNEVTSFAINPGVSAGATWAASGDFSSLAVGENYFTITVTAEDGVTKNSYTICVVRAEAAPTTEAPTTEAPTTEESTEEETEETTEEENEIVPIEVETFAGEFLYAAVSFGELELPEGFTETTLLLSDGEAAALRNEGGLILLYLTDENGENGALYIYDSDSGKAYPFVTVLSPEEGYIFLRIPEEETIPAGYEKTTLLIDELEVDALSNELLPENFFLVYAMDPDGEIGWYRYDSERGLFFPYVSEEDTDMEEELERLMEELLLAQDEIADDEEEIEKDQREIEENEQTIRNRNIALIVLGILLVLALVAAGIFLWLFLRNRGEDDGDDEPPEDPYGSGPDPSNRTDDGDLPNMDDIFTSDDLDLEDDVVISEGGESSSEEESSLNEDKTETFEPISDEDLDFINLNGK